MKGSFGDPTSAVAGAQLGRDTIPTGRVHTPFSWAPKPHLRTKPRSYT